MLDFAIEFRAALDTIAGERDMKLRKYELNDAEWAIARQLRDLLMVFLFHEYFIWLIIALAVKTRHTLFFSSHTQYRDGYPGYGPSGSTLCYKCHKFIPTSLHPCGRYHRETDPQ
jgi:hypothetical protein